MKIQIDIPTKLNDKLKIARIEKGCKDKQELVITIIKWYFGEK